MFSFRMALATLVLCAALPAVAVVPSSYSFSTQSSVTGADTWNSALAGYDPVSGSNYGNVRTFAGLAGASRSLSSLTNELTTDHTPDTANGQHALDNVGAYESLLFSFQSSVMLNDVTIGFPPSGSGLDSDAMVLVYTGTGDPTLNPSVRTHADLLTKGWQIAGNLVDLSTKAGMKGSINTNLSSKYWMVGAFLNIDGNTMIPP